MKQQFKFIYKNEKEKVSFLQNIEKTIQLFHKLNYEDLSGSEMNNKAPGSDSPLLKPLAGTEYKKTLVIADIHQFLVYASDGKVTPSDILLES